MDRRRTGMVLIGAGIALAVLVGVLVYVQTSDAEQLRAAQPKNWTVVASIDIPERSVILPTALRLIQLPREAVPPSAASYLPEPDADTNVVEGRKRALLDQIQGQFTPQRIYVGEVINTDRLGKEALKNTPSYELPPGKVAYVFPIKVNGGSPPNDRMFVAFLNAVRPGDYIDVLYSSLEYPNGMTRDDQEKQRLSDANFLFTRPVMQNVKVINVGLFPDPTGRAEQTPRDERYLTLEVTPQEALSLKWLKDAATFTGNVEFVLRSPKDAEAFPSAVVDFSAMSRLYGIGTGR